jgi:hypothetical protein
MRHNLHEEAAGPKQLAYLKFLASLIHGTLSTFVRSQEQYRPEFSRLSDNIHLNLKKTLLYVERLVRMADQSISHVLAVLHTRI